MEYRYSAFKPTESKFANELKSDLNPDKYITKKQNQPKKFFDVFKFEVDRIDDEGYLTNPYLYQIQGANLNYVATQVFLLANKLKNSGYELCIKTIVNELDTLFMTFANEAEKIHDNNQKGVATPVEQFSKDIAYFYVNEILKPAINKKLENLNTIEQ